MIFFFSNICQPRLVLDLLSLLRIPHRIVNWGFQQQNWVWTGVRFTVYTSRTQVKINRRDSFECISFVSSFGCTACSHAHIHDPFENNFRIRTAAQSDQRNVSNIRTSVFTLFSNECTTCLSINIPMMSYIHAMWYDTLPDFFFLFSSLSLSLFLYIYIFIFFHVTYAYQIDKTTTTESTTTSSNSKINKKLKWADRCPSRGKQHWI